jgi:hypothetical protein
MACGSPVNHRQATRDQHEADVQVEMRDLGTAEGHYEGTVVLAKDGHSYGAVLDLQRVYENMRLTQAEDPTQTINLPKLSGSLKFPFLEKVSVDSFKKYADLTNPMGGFSILLFDFGDYDPQTQLLVLPYGVNGYDQGSFGELQGKLSDGVFTGSWWAKPLGEVGSFRFTQAKAMHDGRESISVGDRSNDIVSRPIRLRSTR